MIAVAPRQACTCEPLEPRRLLAAVAPAGRAESSFGSGWKFHLGDVASASATGFNDTAWSGVSVPHTWNALDGQDGGGNYYRGAGWYRRHLVVDTSGADAGREVFLQFDAASTVANVYVNGRPAGEHRGGYSGFTFDVTPLLDRTGTDNVVAVRVSNAGVPDVAPLTADYTFFGGIYRGARVLKTDPLHVDLLDHGGPGVYLTQTNVSAASADLDVRTLVRNDTAGPQAFSVVSELLDADGAVVRSLATPTVVAAGRAMPVSQATTVDAPHLWDGRTDPYLYTVRVHVLDADGIERDAVTQSVGFRSFRIDPDTGFWLNGRPYDLHGVNVHQDRPDKGWAISEADEDEDVALVKEIGATAVRLAHYPHARHLLDRLDAEGILAWAEIPVVNAVTDSDAFRINAADQLREMIRQNYNHASIFTWGIANELADNAAADATSAMLNDVARAEDPNRPTASATNQPDTSPVGFHTGATTFNKYFGWYGGKFSDFGPWADGVRARHPGVPIGISEFGAGASINQHADPVVAVSAGSTWHPEEWQAAFHESHWAQMRARPWLWCKFVWNLADFAADARNEGDAPGRNDKGLVTYDRKTRKDAFFFYKAAWSDEPVVYLTDRRFTGRTRPAADVKVYSNLGAVTLTLNGVPVGTRSSPTGVLTWAGVALKPGANVVVATATRDGQTYADTCTWTYAPPAADAVIARVNFQPSWASVPAGYRVDAGGTFASRNGLTYGWKTANTANTFDRNNMLSPDQRYDTFAYTQKTGGAAQAWELAVANGTYRVRLVAGDPSYNVGHFRFNLEGKPALSGDPAGNSRWFESTTLVTVTDGRLTITNGAGAVNNKLCYLEIFRPAAT